MHIHNWGLLAEYLVILRYLFCGYFPLKHRWKSKVGEIDIIFKRGSSIIFCEVKARSSNFPIERIVSRTQEQRLKNSAELFLSKNHKMNIKSVQFDLAIVKSVYKIIIYKNWIS